MPIFRFYTVIVTLVAPARRPPLAVPSFTYLIMCAGYLRIWKLHVPRPSRAPRLAQALPRAQARPGAPAPPARARRARPLVSQQTLPRRTRRSLLPGLRFELYEVASGKSLLLANAAATTA